MFAYNYTNILSDIGIIGMLLSTDCVELRAFENTCVINIFRSELISIERTSLSWFMYYTSGSE